MMSMLQQIRAALSGADEEATQPLGRWTPLPRPVLKLITHASMRARLAVLGALAAVVVLLLYALGQPAAEPGNAGGANPSVSAPPPGFGAPPPAAGVEPVSIAVSTRRDSALAARDRAIVAGAQKNTVPALLLAETMFQASEQALQRGDQSLALRGYVEAAQRYGRARAESLLRQQDFTLAKVAAQSAEQIGIDAGIAPPSTQPPEARAAVDVLLDDLGRALASQRISNIRVLYPGLTEAERRGWEAFFRDWNQITAKFTVEDFKVQGATATGNVHAMFEYVPAPGGAPRVDRRRFAMRFEKKDAGWRLAAVNELK